MTKRILVIEDDKDILEILGIIFQDEGFDVILSSTGAATEHIEALHPDLILLDVRINGYDKRGDEICSELRSRYNPQELPIILISAEMDIHRLASDCGANGYVKKPFDIAKLSRTVNEFLTA